MACAHSVIADSAQEKADLFYVESNWIIKKSKGVGKRQEFFSVSL